MVDVLDIVHWVAGDVETGTHLRKWGSSSRCLSGFSSSLDHMDRVAGLGRQLWKTLSLLLAYRNLVRRDRIIVLQHLSYLISYDSSDEGMTYQSKSTSAFPLRLHSCLRSPLSTEEQSWKVRW